MKPLDFHVSTHELKSKLLTGGLGRGLSRGVL